MSRVIVNFPQVLHCYYFRALVITSIKIFLKLEVKSTFNFIRDGSHSVPSTGVVCFQERQIVKPSAEFWSSQSSQYFLCDSYMTSYTDENQCFALKLPRRSISAAILSQSVILLAGIYFQLPTVTLLISFSSFRPSDFC